MLEVIGPVRLRTVCEVLEAIRRAKSSAKVSSVRKSSRSWCVRRLNFSRRRQVRRGPQSGGGVATLMAREETELLVEVILADA